MIQKRLTVAGWKLKEKGGGALAVLPVHSFENAETKRVRARSKKKVLSRVCRTNDNT
jgi:hypothetical protein